MKIPLNIVIDDMDNSLCSSDCSFLFDIFGSTNKYCLLFTANGPLEMIDQMRRCVSCIEKFPMATKIESTTINRKNNLLEI